MYIFMFIFILNSISYCHAHVDSAKLPSENARLEPLPKNNNSYIWQLTEECNIADICRHDQVPMCGIDSCGEMRTFIDSCDMHEFNCDSKKDFVQKPVHECWVTCKRGRSFKKPEFSADCDAQNMV